MTHSLLNENKISQQILEITHRFLYKARMRFCVGRRILFVVMILGWCTAVADGKPTITPTPRAVEHNNRGAVLLSAGKYTEAEFELKTALQLSADYAEAHNNLGILYKQQGLLDLALQHFKSAIKIDKDYATPYSHIGAVYIQQGKFDQAIESLHLAIKKDATFAEAHYNMGLAYFMKGREAKDDGARHKLYESAEEKFRLATQLKPHFVEAHLNLADLYVEMNRLEDAAIRYRLALEDSANKAHVYEQLAKVLQLQGKTKEAQNMRQQGTSEQTATDARARYDEGIAAIQEGEALQADKKIPESKVAFGRAVTALARAVQLQPKSLDALYGLGVAHERLAHHREARTAWERVLTIDPQHAGSLYNLGTLDFQESHVSAGTVHFCNFLKAHANNFPSQAQIAQQYLRDHKLQCPN